jgi:hypothetical protein
MLSHFGKEVGQVVLPVTVMMNVPFTFEHAPTTTTSAHPGTDTSQLAIYVLVCCRLTRAAVPSFSPAAKLVLLSAVKQYIHQLGLPTDWYGTVSTAAAQRPSDWAGAETTNWDQSGHTVGNRP